MLGEVMMEINPLVLSLVDLAPGTNDANCRVPVGM
ncbi:hypothetical protein E2C01_045307 [Portunus trituberculatus]|uniref:Uncharacterized protein n=1 Tax=Portunus trituberculatus TaxID=210409 RepID=A0A5B7FVE6_PORTR|nr:hypothetical protein [Portunus trituberculatus]